MVPINQHSYALRRKLLTQKRRLFADLLRFSILGISLLGLALVSCSQTPATKPQSNEPGQASKEAVTLKVGVLPIVDTLPLHVADTEGMFAKQNIKVELVPFASAIERDTSLASGQIDGELNDLISVGLLNKDGEKVKVVRIALRSTPEFPQFTILVNPQSPVKSVADLKGRDIAISKNTVIEYVTDELLAEKGLKDGDAKLTEVSKIPVRLEMLTKGQIGAITVPEPFTSLAKKDGARVIADDGADQLGQSVITFRQEILSRNPNAVKSFLLAYEQAVDAINASPEKYRSLLIDRAKIPESIKDTFRVPKYPKASVPKEAEVEKVAKWMVSKGLLPKMVSYGQMVDSSFLPK